MRRGPRTSYDPEALLVLLDLHSTHERGGHPVRLRKFINGVPVSDSDARMIRRWRVGTIKGITAKSADALLQRYQLNQEDHA